MQVSRSLIYISLSSYGFRREGIGCPKQEKVLISEHTTLRRHAASAHAVGFASSLQYVEFLLTSAPQRCYRKWCHLNNFDSMLPEDTKKCKCIEKQPSVTEHFGPEDRDARRIPYRNKALETAALEWLIETNQVSTYYVFVCNILCDIYECYSLFRHSTTLRSRRCLTLRPGPVGTFGFPRPSSQGLGLSRCSSSSCTHCANASTFVFFGFLYFSVH